MEENIEDVAFQAKTHSTLAVVLSQILKALCVMTPTEFADRVEAQVEIDKADIVEKANIEECVDN